MADSPELLDATDETIDDAVKYADPMVLRGLLHQLTGDETLADLKTSPSVFGFLEVEALSDPADVTVVQTKAAAFLKEHRDAGAGNLSIGPRERLHRSLSLCAGKDIPESELELWLEQLALDPQARGLVWQTEPSPQRLRNFSVAIIGAGMGGLNAAVLLKMAGIPFVVLEKNPSVGGTWYENRYPGARVDSPSRAYTHVFGVEFDYPNPFCDQSENEKYFSWVADEFGVREHIVFETEVEAASWDEGASVWELDVKGPEGRFSTKADVVISSVGCLSRPSIPQFEGMDSFRGRLFHSARWPADLDVTGRRVAVIGTGCSGYQMVPEIAKVAGHTYVFQRTPNWCFEVDGYLAPFPPQVNWLDRNLPYHRNFMRFRTGWLYGPETLRRVFEVDPEFDDPQALSELNKTVREQRVEFVQRKLAGRPELVAKMVPAEPPMTARPVLIDSNDSIFDALLRDDVTLVTEGIRRITADGIEVADSGEFAVDVIVLATGFKANEFLWPMKVRGRDEQSAEQLWAKDGARAYLGTMLPGFPNFFMIYGPNSNPMSGFQVVDMEEMTTRFALECIRALVEQCKKTVEVTLEAYWRYNDEIDRWESTKTYHIPVVRNYFKNEHGRSAVNSPIDGRRMWGLLRSPVAPRPDVVVYSDGPSREGPEIRPYFGEDLVVE